MLNKVQLLLRAHGDIDDLSEKTKLIGQVLFKQIENKPGARRRTARSILGYVEKTVHGQRMGGRGFDAFLELGYHDAPLHDLINLVGGVSRQLGSVCDANASYALVGTEYPFTHGDTDTTLLVALSRPLSMTYEDFHRHWLNKHGWLVQGNHSGRSTGYGQFHADPKASYLAAQSAGFGGHDYEGVAYAYFSDPEAYVKVLGNASALAAIYKDEERFIEFEGSAPGLYAVTST